MLPSGGAASLVMLALAHCRKRAGACGRVWTRVDAWARVDAESACPTAAPALAAALPLTAPDGASGRPPAEADGGVVQGRGGPAGLRADAGDALLGVPEPLLTLRVRQPHHGRVGAEIAAE